MLFKIRIPYVGLLFTNFLLSTRGNVYQIYEWVAKHAGLLRVYYITAPRMSLCNRYLAGKFVQPYYSSLYDVVIN